MYCYTKRFLITGLSVIIASALGVGFTFGKIAYRPERAQVSQPAPMVSYTVPTGSPSPSLPAREDSPGWDCRVQGNHVCQVDGELWLNLNHLPASLYARCVLGLGATGLSPEVASIDTDKVCKPLYVNG